MFLAIAIIPLLFVSTLTFINYKNSLEHTRIIDLLNVAAFKADNIEIYFNGLKADMEVSQSLYNVRKNFPILNNFAAEPGNPNFIAAKNMLDSQLQTMQSIWAVTDIMLVNPNGKVVYSSNSEHFSKYFLRPLPDPEQKAFEQGKSRLYLSDVFMNRQEGNRLSMLLTAPAVDSNNAFVGVIAFEVDMVPVYNLMKDATGLGKTGEILVARKLDGQVIYLNPLRHDPNAALNRIIDIGDKIGAPIQQAVQGKNGAGRLMDYRGKYVIAAWRYIPSLDWGVVAKIDTEEAFADVTNLRNLVALLFAFISIITAIIAAYIAKTISNTVKKLAEGAQIIGSGNLDYKLETNRRDELGQLARTFNKMTSDLKKTTASRDELNKEITERKKAEDTIQQTLEELRRSNKELDQFAYVASHDLQEPLRIVSGFIQLLQQRYQGKLDIQADEFINFAVKGVYQMQALINDLLTYSRIETRGKQFETVDCAKLLDRVLDDMEPMIRRNGAVITVGHLPEIKADAVQVTQLFRNLIGNAIKFRSDKPPEIFISAELKDNKWVFSVKDNGIGIESQYLDRIFVLFQRLHGRDKYEGTGIGLTICKKIVERHNGKIWVESQPGQGSTFYFTI